MKPNNHLFKSNISSFMTVSILLIVVICWIESVAAFAQKSPIEAAYTNCNEIVKLSVPAIDIHHQQDALNALTTFRSPKKSSHPITSKRRSIFPAQGVKPTVYRQFVQNVQAFDRFVQAQKQSSSSPLQQMTNSLFIKVSTHTSKEYNQYFAAPNIHSTNKKFPNRPKRSYTALGSWLSVSSNTAGSDSSDRFLQSFHARSPQPHQITQQTI